MIRIVNGEIVRDDAAGEDDAGRRSLRSSSGEDAHLDHRAQPPLPERQNGILDQLEEPLPVFGYPVAKKWLGACCVELCEPAGIR